MAGFAGAALAETPNAVPQAPFASTKTHAEVQADLAAYQRAGVNPWSASYNPLRTFRSTKTRAFIDMLRIALGADDAVADGA